ncbi:MAG: alpha/beta hydrolase-fold protein [Sumerlaeia bacterium]
MFRASLFILVSTLFATLAPAESERLRTVKHFSQSLNKRVSFGIYVPEIHSAEDLFPVVYVLHGFGNSHRTAIDILKADLSAERLQLIVVFAEGEESWFVNNATNPEKQYESYIINNLIPEVDQLFPTVAKAEARGICGWSMGGNGALMLAARNPGIFGTVSSMSGIFDLSQHQDQWGIAESLGAELAEDPELWKAHSAYYLADSLIQQNINLLIDVGIEDVFTKSVDHNRALHGYLHSKNADHIYRELPGNHNQDLWAPNLSNHLWYHQAMMVDFVPNLKSHERHCFERLRLFARENARQNLPTSLKKSVMLLGSSSSEGFPSELLPGYEIINRGIGSDVLGIGNRGLLRHMELSVFDQNPDVILFQMGLNDLGDMARTGAPLFHEISQAYRQVLDQIQSRKPSTTVILQRVTPVAGRYAHLAQPVDELNKELERIAKEYDFLLLDNHSPFRSDDGLLKDEYTKDGLHLNEEGMKIWADVLSKGLAEKGFLPMAYATGMGLGIKPTTEE